jgi:oxygen-independent coproporphyrinogen-3 oxidase
MTVDEGSWGVYIHVPWCRVRCPYCAFAVVPGEGAPTFEPWLAAVSAEITARRAHFGSPLRSRPSTLFFGGGTPSRLPPRALRQLVETVAATSEVSAEVNPEDADDEWLAGAREAGITRVSLGVQSFLRPLRKRLGRDWVAADPERIARRVADAGFNSWSIDLIFAVPGQQLADLDADLDLVDALGVPHVALYGLTFEPGTPFERAQKRGRMSAVDDDLWRRMYDHVVDRLGRAGLERVELSNFARPGHASTHNELYWTDRPYLGAGPSAHGYLPDGRRYYNHADLSRYVGAADPTDAWELPSPREAATDRLVSGLRGRFGVDLGRLARKTGLRPSARSLDDLQVRGLVWINDDHIGLTADGFPLCDAVVAWLSDRLEAVGE